MSLRAARRAAIGRSPMAFGRHRQSAGTVCVRPQPTKPAPASRETRLALRPSMLAQASMEQRPTFLSGDRTPYPADEGLQ
jgi:hypothetical protein